MLYTQLWVSLPSKAAGGGIMHVRVTNVGTTPPLRGEHGMKARIIRQLEYVEDVFW